MSKLSLLCLITFAKHKYQMHFSHITNLHSLTAFPAKFRCASSLVLMSTFLVILLDKKCMCFPLFCFIYLFYFISVVIPVHPCMSLENKDVFCYFLSKIKVFLIPVRTVGAVGALALKMIKNTISMM